MWTDPNKDQVLDGIEGLRDAYWCTNCESHFCEPNFEDGDDMHPVVTLDPEGDCGSDMVLAEGQSVWIRVAGTNIVVYLHRPFSGPVIGIETFYDQKPELPGIESGIPLTTTAIHEDDIESYKEEVRSWLKAI